MHWGSWTFATGEGFELASGWQGFEDQARERAHEFANQQGEPIDFWELGHADKVETVWPESETGAVEPDAYCRKHGRPRWQCAYPNAGMWRRWRRLKD